MKKLREMVFVDNENAFNFKDVLHDTFRDDKRKGKGYGYLNNIIENGNPEENNVNEILYQLYLLVYLPLKYPGWHKFSQSLYDFVLKHENRLNISEKRKIAYYSKYMPLNWKIKVWGGLDALIDEYASDIENGNIKNNMNIFEKTFNYDYFGFSEFQKERIMENKIIQFHIIQKLLDKGWKISEEAFYDGKWFGSENEEIRLDIDSKLIYTWSISNSNPIESLKCENGKYIINICSMYRDFIDKKTYEKLTHEDVLEFISIKNILKCNNIKSGIITFIKDSEPELVYCKSFDCPELIVPQIYEEIIDFYELPVFERVK